MKCPKCGSELEKTGGGHHTQKYPRKWGYECLNKNCTYWHKHGRIENGMFKLDSELAEKKIIN